jgi:hypothetical protein
VAGGAKNCSFLVDIREANTYDFATFCISLVSCPVALAKTPRVKAFKEASQITRASIDESQERLCYFSNILKFTRQTSSGPCASSSKLSETNHRETGWDFEAV